MFVCLLGCVSAIRKIKDEIKIFLREPAIIFALKSGKILQFAHNENFL